MRYLLTTETLLDLCGTSRGDVHRWATGHPVKDIRVSVVNVAEATASIQQVPVTGQRRGWEHRLTAFLANLAEESGVAPLAFDAGCAKHWESLMFDPLFHASSQLRLMAYATALHNRLAVVEPPESYTQDMQQRGMAFSWI